MAMTKKAKKDRNTLWRDDDDSNLAFLIRRQQKWARRLGPAGLTARSSFLRKTTIAKAPARPFGPRHSSLSSPLQENTTLSSVANAPGPNFSPSRRLPRGLGHAALDSDHAECESKKYLGRLKSLIGEFFGHRSVILITSLPKAYWMVISLTANLKKSLRNYTKFLHQT